MKIQDARRAVLVVTYNGKDISGPIGKSLTSFAYTDSTGRLDDLDIQLEDRERQWQGDWSPAANDKINVEIRTINWDGPGQIKSLPLGSFEVVSCSISGPPNAVSLQAVSLPSSGAKLEKRSKSWEKTKLKTVAQEIADRAGLKLMYETADNPEYDHLQQSEQADLAFLQDTALREGIAIKVSGGNLILFDEFTYEQKDAIATITRGKDNLLGYDFSWSADTAAYRQCVVTYTAVKNKKTLKASYTPPGAPQTGPILRINEQADSEAAAKNLARKRLRERNKEHGKGRLRLMGDIRLAATLTIKLQGWGRFDGKYIIETARHNLGSSGYTTEIEIRKVLGW